MKKNRHVLFGAQHRDGWRRRHKDFAYRNKVVKLDGRLPHEVVNMGEFTGERFSIIVYKNY